MAYQQSAYASCLNPQFLSYCAEFLLQQRFSKRMSDSYGVWKRDRFANSSYVLGDSSTKCHDIPTCNRPSDRQSSARSQTTIAFKDSLSRAIHITFDMSSSMHKPRDLSITAKGIFQFPTYRHTGCKTPKLEALTRSTTPSLHLIAKSLSTRDLPLDIRLHQER